MGIRENLERITATLPQHAVTLVAVSKYATPDQMIEAYEAGIRHFGENKPQDALTKKQQLPPELVSDVTWHFIGHLQRNKVNKTIGQFSLIHSVDTVTLAEALSLRNVNAGFVQPILLQINISNEKTKHGFSHEESLGALEAIRNLPGVHVRGLMTMAPATQDVDRVVQAFCGLRALRDQMSAQLAMALPELSMGMSQDYIHAIHCGATIIRLGSALFSNR